MLVFLKMQPPRAAASTISLPLLLSSLASPPPPLQPHVLFLHPFSFLVSLADDDDDYDDYTMTGMQPASPHGGETMKMQANPP